MYAMFERTTINTLEGTPQIKFILAGTDQQLDIHVWMRFNPPLPLAFTKCKGQIRDHGHYVTKFK